MKFITQFKQQLFCMMCFTMLLTSPMYSLTPNGEVNNLETADCSDCDGKITTLSLQYTGDLQDPTIVVKQKKGEIIVFNDVVAKGETFSFTGVDKKGTLGTLIYIYINGTLAGEIHTSCSVPVHPGMYFGDFLVIAGASRNGGNLCPIESGETPDDETPDDETPDDETPDSSDCSDCDGKITTLSLQYTGDLQDASIVVKQKKGEIIVFNELVAKGETFSFTGVDKKGTLGTMIYIYINGTLASEIHTSCSVPVQPGMYFGDFLVIAGASRNGGNLCPIEDIEPPCDVSVSEDLTNCPGQSATLVATGGDSYLWSTGETTATITKYPTQTTTYSVDIATSTCVMTKEITVTILVTNACGATKVSPTLTLYPTTVSSQDKIHLSFNVDKSQDISVTIFNLYGHQMHQYKIQGYTSDENELTLPLGEISHLDSGLYLVTIKGNGWTKSKRILIE